MYVVLGSFLIGISKLVDKLPFAENLAMLDAMTQTTSLSDYFTQDKTSGVSIVGSFKRILFVFLALKSRLIIQDKKYDFVVLMYSIGCIIYLCFNGSMLQMLAGRGCMYFNIFDINNFNSDIKNIDIIIHLNKINLYVKT